MVSAKTRVTVIGLGYVGLPLAVVLAQRFETFGLDVDSERIKELVANFDRTGEISERRLERSTLALTSAPSACPPSHFYIVTVPTPIDEANRPDLTILKSASASVGQMLKDAFKASIRPVIIYESTVYPGVTEDVCSPIIEEISGLKSGRDFFLAYSPERINPGDKEHTIDKITKVVSGQNPQVLDEVSQLYESITSGGVFRAASIRAAEAAKVIENAQRDINIAFMNEITQIFGSMGLSIWDVLEAANTKWNFLPFTPGLVGGHCIGVDPYYLSHRAEELGHDPKVILAGRGVNDAMAKWVADELHKAIGGKASSVLVLGMTFKENVPDLRNSKVADLISALSNHGHQVTVHDPHADPTEARSEYGLVLEPDALGATYDVVLLAVAHQYYLDLGATKLRTMTSIGGLLADLKGELGGAADWTL